MASVFPLLQIEQLMETTVLVSVLIAVAFTLRKHAEEKERNLNKCRQSETAIHRAKVRVRKKED